MCLCTYLYTRTKIPLHCRTVRRRRREAFVGSIIAVFVFLTVGAYLLYVLSSPVPVTALAFCASHFVFCRSGSCYCCHRRRRRRRCYSYYLLLCTWPTMTL